MADLTVSGVFNFHIVQCNISRVDVVQYFVVQHLKLTFSYIFDYGEKGNYIYIGMFSPTIYTGGSFTFIFNQVQSKVFI